MAVAVQLVRIQEHIFLKISLEQEESPSASTSKVSHDMDIYESG